MGTEFNRKLVMHDREHCIVTYGNGLVCKDRKVLLANLTLSEAKGILASYSEDVVDYPYQFPVIEKQ